MQTPTRRPPITAAQHDANMRDYGDYALALAVKTVKRFNRGGTFWFDPGAVEGAAYLGAAKALAKFDPARGVKFSSFAICCIRGEIREEMRQQDHLPRSLRTKAKAHEREHDELPSWAEPPRSTDAEIAHTGDEDALVVLFGRETLAAAEETHPRACERLARANLRTCLEWLPRMEREVLVRHYYEDKSFREISREIARSESRVHQLHTAGMERLRLRLGDPENLFAL